MQRESSLLMIILILLLFGAGCESRKRGRDSSARAPYPFHYLDDAEGTVNPVITKIISRISPESLDATIKTLASFETRHSFSDTTKDQRGIGAARRWIVQELKKYKEGCGGRLQIRYDKWRQRTQTHGNVTLVNIIASLPGKSLASQDRTILLCAHYDSRASDAEDAVIAAPGADDNASGVAVVMELARILSQYQFESEIVFALVDGNEQGLLGSSRLAETAQRGGWPLIAVLSLNAVGNIIGGNGIIDSTTIRCFSEGMPYGESGEVAEMRAKIGGEGDSPSRQLARYSKRISAAYVDELSVEMRYRPSEHGVDSDHIPFNVKGYAAIHLTEANRNHLFAHQTVRIENGMQYGDLPRFVSISYVNKVAKVVSAVVASLALSPHPPEGVSIETIDHYNTLLRWSISNPDSDLSGYKILLRETTSPVWQKQLFISRPERSPVECVLRNISFDDYFVALAAVDLDGNESVPVFPRSTSSQH